MVGVEQWAEIRRLHRVERLSIREISKRTGLHRKTIRRALTAPIPPRYVRVPAGSKLDPFKEWICEQLRVDPLIQSQRVREMAAEIGYVGGKTIFDDYVREVRPRFERPRTFQRTIYRPGELVQCDLWEPREPIPVGHGQYRRGWVVTAEVCWSRVIAGTLIFSKEAPDILWGLGRCLSRLGVLPEKLVWDREAAIAGGGRSTSPTWPSPTSATSSLNPIRPSVEAPDRPVSSSTTDTDSAGQPSSIARSLSAYCRAEDSTLRSTWCSVDCRTYTTARRRRC